jgi:hypothetical protein
VPALDCVHAMCNTVRHFSICAVHVSDQRHQRNMTMRLLRHAHQTAG